MNRYKEEVLTESFFFSKGDVKWNEDKFNNGEINLCFVLGYSGSGKSTFTRGIKSTIFHKRTVIELDQVVQGYDKDITYFDKFPTIVKSYVNGQGRRFIDTEVTNELEHFQKVATDYIDYIMRYAASHKTEQFTAEGIWTFVYYEPKDLEKYAVYIKGTSALRSTIQASKRGSNFGSKGGKMEKIGYTLQSISTNFALAAINKLEVFTNYFREKTEKDKEEKRIDAGAKLREVLGKEKKPQEEIEVIRLKSGGSKYSINPTESKNPFKKTVKKLISGKKDKD